MDKDDGLRVKGGAAPIGKRLRAQREAAGLSLRELARNVGVTPSLISQIENGKTTPSVGTLYSIVLELGVSLDELFDMPNAGLGNPGGSKSPHELQWEAPSEGPVLRAHNRLVLTLDTGVRWERLTASADPRVDFLFVVYPPGGESCPADSLMTHSGFEYGIVLDGALGATVGEDDYELAGGDSIAFDSRTPHRLWAIGPDSATAIWTVVGRQGDSRLD